MTQCWELDPSLRPTAQDIIQRLSQKPFVDDDRFSCCSDNVYIDTPTQSNGTPTQANDTPTQANDTPTQSN